MPNVTLTARGIGALETEGARVDYWDDLLPGFGVRVSATGTRTFFVRYRANGRQRRMVLGRFPTTTLADARERARAKLSAVQEGEDRPDNSPEFPSTTAAPFMYNYIPNPGVVFSADKAANTDLLDNTVLWGDSMRNLCTY